MSEKRWGKRFRKSLRVRFGTENLDEVGFTEDISPQGFFIKTTRTYESEIKLRVEIELEDGNLVLVEGLAPWAHHEDMNRAWMVSDAGMGFKIVRFLSGEFQYQELCQQLCLEEAQRRRSQGMFKDLRG